LGHLEDDALRSAIVRTYTLLKGLADTHVVNNELHQKLDLMTQSTFGYAAANNSWIEFAWEIKAVYTQTKENVDRLNELLQQSLQRQHK